MHIESTKLNMQVRHPHDRASFLQNKNERRECQQNKKSRSKKTTFKAAAAVCGAGSLVRCPLVGLVPATLPAISFLPSSTAVSLRLLPLPFLFPWGPPVADTWRFLLNVASVSCHLAMKRFAASRTPRYHVPAFLAATVPTAAFTPKSNWSVPWTPRCHRTL